jgi:tryptophanyl-tRNA synthetase
MLIPGTNGGKMSKSANNIINIFLMTVVTQTSNEH